MSYCENIWRLTVLSLYLYFILLAIGVDSAAAAFNRSDDDTPKHKIRMQVVLGEGLGWPGSIGEATARHIILTLTTPTNAGSDTAIKMPASLSQFLELPLPGERLYVRSGSTSPVACNTEKGDGSPYFVKCDLISTSSRTFITNTLGRVSFSLTNADEVMGGNLLYVRSDSMGLNEWYRFHTDHHDLYLLSKIQKEHLVEINRNISTPSALAATSAIQSLAKRAMKFQVRDNHSHLKKRSQLPIWNARDLYDSDRNYVFGERLIDTNPHKDGMSSRRDIIYPSTLFAHERDARLKRREIPLDHYETRLTETFSNHTFLSIDSKHEWALSLNHENKLVHFFRNVRKRIIDTVAQCWDVLKSILKAISLPFKTLKEKIKALFRFDEISRTHEYLDLFYDMLMPLGVRGLSMVNNRYKDFIVNATESSHHLFESAIKHMGGHDITLDELSKQTTQEANHVTLSKLGQDGIAKGLTPLNADARTHFLHDRILNNLDHHLIDFQNTTVWDRFKDILREISGGLERAFDRKVLESAYPHLIEFAQGANRSKMTIGHLLNFIRSFITLGTGFATNIFEIVVQSLPAYWNLAVAFMTMPLKIPFLDKLFKHKLSTESRQKKQLTPLSVLTWIGSTFATWQYMVSNRGQGPIREIDLEVLRDVKEPELMLYTWNNDARTRAVDKPQWLQHRLGIYDWIPRIHMTAIQTIQVLSLDGLILFSGANPADPGVWSKPGQMFGVLSNVMVRIQGFPFTQLNTTDSKALDHARQNPDLRFLGWWTWWMVEDVIRFSRNFLKSLNRYPLSAIANVFVVGIPCTMYGVPVTIDTGKEISPSDIPRKIVLKTMWVEMALTYFGLVFPFIQETKLKTGFLQKYGLSSWAQIPAELMQRFNKKMSLINIGRSAASLTMTYTRNILMTTSHVVGMLSSSYQGGSSGGDASRPVDM